MFAQRVPADADALDVIKSVNRRLTKLAAQRDGGSVISLAVAVRPRWRRGSFHDLMILSFKEEEKREDGGNHFSTGMEQGGREPSVTEGRGADRSEAFKHPGCRLPASCSSAAVAHIVFNYCCSG